MTRLQIAIKNLRGSRFRSLSLFLVIFALSGTLLCISLLYAGLARSVELSRQRLGADIMVVPEARAGQAEALFLMGSAGSFTMSGARSLQEQILRTYEDVAAATPQLFIVSAPLPCCSVADTMIVGFDPATDFVITPWLTEGKGQGRPQGQNEALAGADILAGVGGRLKLFGQEFVVRGKLERTDLPYLDSGIFIPLEGVRRMAEESKQKARRTLTIGPDEVSSILLRLKDGANADRTAIRLEHDFPGRKALVVARMVRRSAEGLSIPLKGMTFLLAFQWAAGLFLMGVVHSFSVDLRRRELGILKALGAKDGDVRAILLIEATVLAAAACLAGISAGLLLVRAVSGTLFPMTALPVSLPAGAALAGIAATVFAVSLVFSVLPSVFSVRRAARIEPFYLVAGDVEGKGGRP